MLDVKVILPDGSERTFEDIAYVSLYNTETYGPPPLVAPVPGSGSVARSDIDEAVLYINTAVTPLFEITRTTP